MMLSAKQRKPRKMGCMMLQKAKCETEKSGEKTLCQGGKATVEAIDRTGNFANIDGSFGTGSAVLDIVFSKIAITDNLDTLNLGMLVSAQGGADTHLKFTPLDIVGHLACQIPWTNDKRVNIEVPPQSFSLTGSLRGHQNGTALSYSAKIATSGLEAQIKPSPRDLILTSYNMTLSCLPIAPLIHTLNLSASVFIPELRGIITLPGQEKELSFALKPKTDRPNHLGNPCRRAFCRYWQSPLCDGRRGQIVGFRSTV
jgi:hypothetical protein